MSKLHVSKMKWKSEVEEQEIELIERGIPPVDSYDLAINMVTNRRRKKHADKSGS